MCSVSCYIDREMGGEGEVQQLSQGKEEEKGTLVGYGRRMGELCDHGGRRRDVCISAL